MKITGKVDLTTWNFGIHVETLPPKVRKAVLAEVSKVIEAELREGKQAMGKLFPTEDLQDVEFVVDIPLGEDDYRTVLATGSLRKLVDDAIVVQWDGEEGLTAMADQFEKQAKRLRKAAKKLALSQNAPATSTE